jgi:hypothetical protein
VVVGSGVVVVGSGVVVVGSGVVVVGSGVVVVGSGVVVVGSGVVVVGGTVGDIVGGRVDGLAPQELPIKIFLSFGMQLSYKVSPAEFLINTQANPSWQSQDNLHLRFK